MSMLTMYWIIKLDDFRCALNGAWCISFSMFVVVVIVLGILGSDYGFEWFWKRCRPILLLLVFGFVSLLVRSFLPSTKQMAAIIVIPAVLNNERVQELGDKALDTGDLLLTLTQEYIQEHLKKPEGVNHGTNNSNI